MRHLDGYDWIFVALGIFVFLFFVVGITWMAVQDHKATENCHQMNGQTWDSGEHCVIGDYKVVSTR